MATSNPIWESRGWLGAVAVLLFFVVIQASGAIANWTAPEKKMTEAEFLSMMENAKFIELRGQLGSSNDFTYIYVDDERVGTTKNKGWWNMKWPIINKGQNLYTLQYSDHKSNEEQFTSYEFVGIESGVLGYAQLITEDLHHMVYFYDKYDELVGYADIEPAWAGYRSEWTIWDPEGEPIYSLTADYNPLDRQLTHKIFKQKESDLNFFQAMWITYMTREDMKRYYKD